MKKFFLTLFFIIISVGFSAAQNRIKKMNLTETDRIRWFNVLKWDDEDSILPNINSYRNAGVTFYKLDKKRYLIEIITSSAAYQQQYVYAVLNEENRRKPTAKLLRFTTFFVDEENQKTTKETGIFLTGISTFDSKRKNLKMFYKGAGAGFCGSLETYKIMGNKAQTIESRHRGCGNAINVPPPENWKKIKIF